MSASPVPTSLVVDLEDSVEVSRFKVYFYYDNERYYKFKIALSNDNLNYETVAEFQQQKISDYNGYELKINKRKARYIKLEVLYNSANNTAHVRELEVFSD